MKLTIAIFLSIYCFSSSAQNFIKSYEILPLHNERGNAILFDDSNFYVQLGAVCQTTSNDCTMLAKTDHQGNLVASTVMDYIDAGRTPFLQNDTNLLVAGHSPDLNARQPLISLFDKNCDSLDLKELSVFNEFSFILVQEMIQYDQFHILSFNGIDTIGNDVSRILWVDQSGTIDSVMSFNNGISSRCTHLSIGSDGLLNVGCVEVSENVQVIRRFIKYDMNKKVIDEYSSTPKKFDSFYITTSLGIDNSPAYVEGFELNDNVPSIVKIADYEQIQWRYDFGFEDNFVIPFKLFTALNGDILGCGLNEYVHKPLVVGRSAFIFRLNSEGDLLWRREYRKVDELNELPLDMQLFDIKELPNGDLIMTGNVDRFVGDQKKDDLLLMRTNANGCIDEDCGEVQYVTSTKTPNSSMLKFRIYPNPANSFINLTLPNFETNLGVQIYSTDGILMSSANMINQGEQIDISDLPSGIFVLKLLGGSQVLGYRKFVVVK